MSELYKKSGVNLFEADRLVNKLKILGDNFTEFAGSTTFEKNKIVACCDGIGSKILPLYERKLFKNIAIEVAAANLNDLSTKNAKALAFCDYIAVQKLESDYIFEIISNLQEILGKYDCVLLGGETSELHNLLKENAIDICGFAIGIQPENFVQQDISENDIVISLKSSGIHANGFSLIQKFYDENKLTDFEYEQCLIPTYIYYDTVKELWNKNLIKAAANITGGGIYSNIIRTIPKDLDVKIEFEKLPSVNIFDKLKKLCDKEVYNIFNCGIGFCMIADKINYNQISEICKEYNPSIIGKVVKK